MTDLRQAAMLALEALTIYSDAQCSLKGRNAISALEQALAQPEQEPVAWEHHEYRPYGAPGEIRIHAILASQYMLPDGSVSSSFQWLVDEYRADKNTIKLIPLYTTPPAAQPEQVDCPRCGHVCSQRPWVGLTDEEANLLWENTDDRDSWELIKRVEAKLKERNT